MRANGNFGSGKSVNNAVTGNLYFSAITRNVFCTNAGPINFTFEDFFFLLKNQWRRSGAVVQLYGFESFSRNDLKFIRLLHVFGFLNTIIQYSVSTNRSPVLFTQNSERSEGSTKSTWQNSKQCMQQTVTVKGDQNYWRVNRYKFRNENLETRQCKNKEQHKSYQK